MISVSAPFVCPNQTMHIPAVMAPPPIPDSASGSTSASTSGGAHTSSRARGKVKYADESDQGECGFNVDDNENTPRCRTRLTSKHRVISPGNQGPASQRPRIDDPVSNCYLIPGSELISRCRKPVGHADRNSRPVCLTLGGKRHLRVITAHAIKSAASPWRNGPKP